MHVKVGNPLTALHQILRRGSLGAPGATGHCVETLSAVTAGDDGGVLPTPGGWRAGTLLRILLCAGQPSTAHNSSARSTGGAGVRDTALFLLRGGQEREVVHAAHALSTKCPPPAGRALLLFHKRVPSSCTSQAGVPPPGMRLWHLDPSAVWEASAQPPKPVPPTASSDIPLQVCHKVLSFSRRTMM